MIPVLLALLWQPAAPTLLYALPVPTTATQAAQECASGQLPAFSVVVTNWLDGHQEFTVFWTRTPHQGCILSTWEQQPGGWARQ